MYRKIADQIKYPEWVKRWPRYRRLDTYDRLLDGCFYDHLSYAFYDEFDQQQKLILLENRRPSAQFRLPRMVSRWCSRKLFAGRHAPKLRLGTGKQDDKAAKASRKALAPLNSLLKRAKFWQKMREATLLGSVGSIAVTFRVSEDKKRIAFLLWRAKFCKPSFDEFGDLATLRVSYTASGSGLIALGITKDSEGVEVDATGDYWFIRDFNTTEELTYAPPKKDDWNPVDGFVGEKAATRTLAPIEDMTEPHGFGVVPGHWFLNLPGSEGSDGDCTWGDAIPNSIELDYTLSQTGRGVRYNAAPELVIRGPLINDGDATRSPASLLQVQAGYKDDDGQTRGEGDAKLLEMSGTGTTAALALIDKLRNFALEQIMAARKDPDKMKAPMSGRAMEYLDEDSNDLVMELRSQYGDDGALPLIKKIATATGVMDDATAGQLALQWPRLFQPTPDELFALAQALQIFVDPLSHSTAAQPGKPGTPASKGATGVTKPATPDTPPQEAQVPDEETQILTLAEARAYVRLNMDLEMLDLELDGSDDDSPDDSPSPPDEPTEIVPEPTSIDEDVEDGVGESDTDQSRVGGPTAQPGDSDE